jgi:hypothetical protein
MSKAENFEISALCTNKGRLHKFVSNLLAERGS